MIPSHLGTILLALAVGSAPVPTSAHTAPPATTTALVHGTIAADLTDAQIAAIFEAANTFDIETGAIAAKRGSKAERDFGKQLVHDHTAVRAQGRALVKKLGVKATLPSGNALVETLAKGHADAVKKLKAAKHGSEFDRAFLQHEVDYHKAVIDAVGSTLLPAIKNAELKKLITDVAPAFKAHMDKAQSLLSQVK